MVAVHKNGYKSIDLLKSLLNFYDNICEKKYSIIKLRRKNKIKEKSI